MPDTYSKDSEQTCMNVQITVCNNITAITVHMHHKS